MMRLTSLVCACLLAALGCGSERRSTWHHPSQNVTDIKTLTLIAGLYYLDGGTRELYAITDSGKRCSIRLNQYSLQGKYELGTPTSPGRLCFNDRLIAVRSPSEQRLLDLLQSANLMPLAIEDLRRVHDLDNVASSELAELNALEDVVQIRAIQRHRDAIIHYVNTDQYIEVAKNGS